MTTQRVSASYQEIIDLHTESDKVSILGFHTPSNDEPVYLLKPFWDAYQKVRYRGCSMSFVPAARLPVDPAQVGYEAGEYPIDARDMLNPILFHGCHGEDLGAILNQFYSGDAGYTTSNAGCDIERMFSDSLDHNMVHSTRIGNTPVYESLYYRALTDSSWLKAHPQRGFRKSMRPMVYRVASNTQLNPITSGAGRYPFTADKSDEWDTVDDGERTTSGYSSVGFNGSNSYISGTAAPGLQSTTGDATTGYKVGNPADYSGIQLMTPGIRPLGWMDTRQVVSGTTNYKTVTGNARNDAETIGGNYEFYNGRFSLIPKVFMGICMLPPAYKTQQYFRIIINHHFDFAKYRGISMRSIGTLGTIAPNVTDMNDNGNSKGVVKNGTDDVERVCDD